MVDNTINFDVPDLSKMNWKQVFEVYDNNFKKLKGLIMEIGGMYKIEKFEGLTSKVINLENPYEVSMNQLFVFKNDVIQWKGEDYDETSETQITLKADPELTDVYHVVNVGFMKLIEKLEEIEELQKWLEDKYETVDGIISATIQADWEATEGPSMILNKPKSFPRSMIIGIESVDNTSDEEKPPSEPQKEYFASKEQVRQMIQEAIANLPALTSGPENGQFPANPKDGDVHVKY